jgi:hypothetical protein
MSHFERYSYHNMAKTSLGANLVHECSLSRLLLPYDTKAYVISTQHRVSVRIRSISGTLLWPKVGFRMWANTRMITGPAPRRKLWAITAFPAESTYFALLRLSQDSYPKKTGWQAQAYNGVQGFRFPTITGYS